MKPDLENLKNTLELCDEFIDRAESRKPYRFLPTQKNFENFADQFTEDTLEDVDLESLKAKLEEALRILNTLIKQRDEEITQNFERIKKNPLMEKQGANH